MFYLVGQIFFCLALISMVGLLVGWMLRGIGTHQREREVEATWRMRLRQRDTMLSKMATELAERGAQPGSTSGDGGQSGADELKAARQRISESQAQVAKLQGRVSKRDAQISQLFAEIRRIGGQTAVENLLAQVNKDSFLASGMHLAADLLPEEADASAPKQDKQDVNEQTYTEKASIASASGNNTDGKAETEPDELVFIYGISPALQKRLFRLGVTTFRQLARLDSAGIERLAKALGIEADQIIDENWVEGAREEHLAKYGELT